MPAGKHESITVTMESYLLILDYADLLGGRSMSSVANQIISEIHQMVCCDDERQLGVLPVVGDIRARIAQYSGSNSEKDEALRVAARLQFLAIRKAWRADPNNLPKRKAGRTTGGKRKPKPGASKGTN